MVNSYPNRTEIKKFISDVRGNTAIIFALTAIPITIAVGGAVEFKQASDHRTELQRATDAAVLAAGAQPDKSLSELQVIADSFFASDISTSAQFQVTNTQLQMTGETLTYSADANVNLSLLSLIGMNNVAISASSEAMPRLNASELVIVMDTTGSMSFGSSWSDAKDVINETVQTLSNLQSTNDEFLVTLLPISDRVNVGTDKSSWLSVAAPASWNGCMAPREEPSAEFPYGLTDKSPSQLGFSPSAIGYDDVYDNANASWVDHGSNGNPHDDNLPICPMGITGPTNDPLEIQTALDALTPQGTGRFDEAMAWAWRLVSPNWVGQWDEINYPRPYNQRRKIVVFISDGLTEAYRHEVGGDGDGVSPPNTIYGWNQGSKWGFEHLVGVCEQMKEAGVEIHMVKVNGNSNAKPFFEDCASSPDHFYEVEDADEFQDAVATIQNSVVGLRLTR